MEKITLSRHQFYSLVWSESLLSLSKKYCISDNGLRKMCKSMNIPLPPNGYWQKVKYGKPVKMEILPPKHTGEDEITLHPRTENCSEMTTLITEQSEKEKEIIADTNINLVVPDRLSSRPDPLIVSTKEYYSAMAKYDWRSSAKRPHRVNVLNISVTDDSLPRAYRIMDTLLKAIRSRNHELKINHDRTYVVIHGEEIEIRIRERHKETYIEGIHGRTKVPKPTGEFIFQYGFLLRKQVIGGKQGLEPKMVKILAKMELLGLHKYEQRKEWERQRLIREEQERIAKELKERKDSELKKFAVLYKDALKLHHATVLRKYIEELNQKSDIENEWVEWVSKKIDWYDPLVNGDDELLDDIYKEAAFKYFLSFGINEKL